MSLRIHWRFALVMSCLLGCVASAAAQSITITARTPSRGSTRGGTTVEVIGNGWFATFGTTVTVSGAGAPVTNLVVHNPTRLTFVTPPRPAGAATILVTSTAGSVSRPFTYVAPIARSISGARRPAFSYTGRYVAFESRYALVPEDTNGVNDIYVRDRTNGSVRRVSVSSSGAQGIGGESTHPSISGEGRFVAFQSRATNLVGGDTNGLLDVFVHDRDADGDGVFDESGSAGSVATTRVSMRSPIGAAPPLQAVGGDSGDPSLSGDGRYVAFHSAATNLVTVDTNGFSDVFVHDRLRRLTRKVSTNANLVQGDGHSRNPAISLDGRFVAFESLANNLAGGNPTRFDVFLHDRDNDLDGVFDESNGIDTLLVSANLCSQNLTNHSIDPSITYDGRYVVYSTFAGNAAVDAQCNSIDFNQASDVFIYDRISGNTQRRLSLGTGGEFTGDSASPFINGNGQLLVFATEDVNASGGGVTAAVGVHEAANDGKSTTGTIPSPTDDTPPPADVDPPPPTQGAEDPTASGDGSNTGNTSQPTPGTGGGEPSVEIEELPPDVNDTPFIQSLSPSAGPPSGGNQVQIQGANFVNGQTSVMFGSVTLAPQFVNGSLLRVNAPVGFAFTSVDVRVVVAGQASNPAAYSYVNALSTPVITNINPASGSVAGGYSLAITGTGFSGPHTVRLGPLTAVVTGTPTTTSINVTVPASPVAGPVPVIVENGDGATAVSGGPFTFVMTAPVSAPTLAAVLPPAGPVTGGTAITITGTQFAPGASVTVGGAPASDVQVLSNTQIVALTPAGAEGPADVVVTVPGQGASPAQTFQYEPLAAPVLTCTGTPDADLDLMPDAWEVQYGLSPADPTDAALDPDGDGRTNAQECADLTHPRGFYTRFLAEGATGTFFTTRVVVANPNLAPAHVLFRFLTGSGTVVRRFLTIPARVRRTLDLQLIAGLEAANISTVVESDTEIVVDRTMRWDTVTRGGAHAEASVPAASLQWYLAEGATHGAFDLFYLIQNPSLTTSANVQIRFLLPAGAPIVRNYVVPANTRFTLAVDQIAELASTDVSAVVETTNLVPIIVERAMYSSAAGVFAAGHDSAGVTSPSLQWFFAEGATGSFFDLFLLFANPGASNAAIQATYLLPSGATVVRNYTVNANSRRTVNVAFEDPALADTAVSVAIQSTNAVPIIAERAMWWPHSQPWHEAHNSAGSTTTGTRWAVADGEEGSGGEATQTYILVANTSGVSGTLRVTVLLETGSPLVREYTVAANSRFNVPVGPEFALPAGTRFSAIVESLGGAPAQIVVERAMYWNAAGVIWAAGSNLLATKLQ